MEIPRRTEIFLKNISYPGENKISSPEHENSLLKTKALKYLLTARWEHMKGGHKVQGVHIVWNKAQCPTSGRNADSAEPPLEATKSLCK